MPRRRSAFADLGRMFAGNRRYRKSTTRHQRKSDLAAFRRRTGGKPKWNQGWF